MFLIFGISPRKSDVIFVKDSSGRQYSIFFLANWFSLFFIPLIPFGKNYFINVGNKDVEITQAENEQMKNTGKVILKYENYSAGASAFEQAFDNQGTYNTGSTYANDICPVCKNKLEETFAYCPFCGQKQPRK